MQEIHYFDRFRSLTPMMATGTKEHGDEKQKSEEVEPWACEPVWFKKMKPKT